MKKLFLAISILSAGAVAIGRLHHATNRAVARSLSQSAECASASNRVIDLNSIADALREETHRKKELLSAQWQTAPADGGANVPASQNAKQLLGPQLRSELGIGWNASEDYVLVSKSLLKRIGLQSFTYAPHISEPARAILNVSPEEQSQVTALVHGLRDEQAIRVQRVEPAGEIVAHYIIAADQPGLEQSISNKFSTQVAAILGPQRADIFLASGWRQLQSDLPLVGPEPVTFTVTRSFSDGESKFIWRKQQGKASQSGPVRYAQYPARWFTMVFPKGWRELAEREGFQLPENFETAK